MKLNPDNPEVTQYTRYVRSLDDYSLAALAQKAVYNGLKQLQAEIVFREATERFISKIEASKYENERW